jgi:hypothetical protein
MTNPVKWFLENFGKEPEPRPPIIPVAWRIPFFVALSLASLAALIVLVYFVVMPAIQAQPPAPAPVSTPAK